MFYALSWILVFSLLAIWSLAAWAMHAVAVWGISQAGALTGSTSDVASSAGALRLPEWLAPWVPPQVAEAVASVVSGLAPAVENLLQAAPVLAGGLTAGAWVVWGVGSLLLLMLGAALHVLIALWRRRGSDGPGSSPVVAAG